MMQKIAENYEIGQYLSARITEKFPSQRQFCIAYLKAEGRAADDTAIRNMANRLSQILLGKKAMQIFDLPIFSGLLEVSCEEILSAGARFVPRSDRRTNYSVAFSDDPAVWEEYLHREDRPFLNADEYGKTLIDYALEFQNYAVLKYLTDRKYIWFVDTDEMNPDVGFGAGTSIKPREPHRTDDLTWRMKKTDRLRMQMIALAVKNDDPEMLRTLRAREVPSLYHACALSRTPPDIRRFYDADTVACIAKASPRILDYFSEEFEIRDRVGRVNIFLFPYMSELLDLLVEQGAPSAHNLLECALEHNQRTYRALREWIAQRCEKARAELFGDEVPPEILCELEFYENGRIVSIRDRLTKDGLVTNLVCVCGTPKDGMLREAVQRVNDSYRSICEMCKKE